MRSVAGCCCYCCMEIRCRSYSDRFLMISLFEQRWMEATLRYVCVRRTYATHGRMVYMSREQTQRTKENAQTKNRNFRNASQYHGRKVRFGGFQIELNKRSMAQSKKSVQFIRLSED